MEDDDLIVNPGDSISNKGSGNIKEALFDIKEIEKEKSKGKEKTPIPQSIIFTIFGLFLCFLSYTETSIMSSLNYSYENKNIDKSKLFLEDIKYLSLFIISLIIIKLKIKRPYIYQIILSFLFCFISYSSTYLYSRNAQSFILLSKLFCIILVSMFFGIKNIIGVRKNPSNKLPNLILYGLLLAISGILIEFISSYFITIKYGEDNIRYIYHYNDVPNFFLSFTNGICYAGIIFLFDFYCKSLETIFDTLLYVGLFSGVICFILSLCYSELTKIKITFSHFSSNNQIIHYIISVGLYLFNIILQSILIKKCSIYSAGIMISTQMPIRIIIDFIKYQNTNSNNFTILSLILCISGLYIICYYHISNNYNGEKKDLSNTKSFHSDTNQNNSLVNPNEEDDE